MCACSECCYLRFQPFSMLSACLEVIVVCLCVKFFEIDKIRYCVVIKYLFLKVNTPTSWILYTGTLSYHLPTLNFGKPSSSVFTPASFMMSALEGPQKQSALKEILLKFTKWCLTIIESKVREIADATKFRKIVFAAY